MKPPVILTFLFALIVFNAKPQVGNLVPNGGFEMYSACPTTAGEISLTSGWDNPVGINSTTDYLNSCMQSGGSPNFYANSFGPYTGNGFTRISSLLINSSTTGTQEYLQATLSQPLVAGSQYRVSFYAGLESTSTFSANLLGVNLSDNSVQAIPFPSSVTMQGSVSSTITQLNVTNIGNWQYYEAFFTAQGGETVITIGNFLLNNNLSNVNIFSSSQGMIELNMCYIDDVKLELYDPCTFGISNSVDSAENHIFPCNGDIVDISAYSVDSSYVPTWNNSFTTHNFSTDTSGVYILSYTSNGCNYSDTIIVEFIDLQNTVVSDTNLCLGDTLFLYAQDSAFTQILYSNNVFVDSGQVIPVTQAGNYTLEISQEECLQSVDFSLFIESPPLLNLIEQEVMCEGLANVLLNASSSNATDFLWSTGEVTSTISVSDTGWYYLEVSNFCGNTIDSVHVVLGEPYYHLNFVGDTLICTSADLDVQIQGVNLTALWNDGAINQQRSLSEGLWWVEITDSACTYRDSINIRFPSPIDLNVDTLMCEGDTLYLSYFDPLMDSLMWEDGTNLSSWETTQAGYHSLTVYQEYCVLRDSFLYEILPPPILDYKDTVVCTEGYLVLPMLASNYYQVNGNPATAPYFIQNSGYYFLEASNKCGMSTIDFYVEEIDCSCPIYAPNTFTPNGDENNPTWRPSSACVFSAYELSIYNRWGELIFYSNDPEFAWDGTYNGAVVKEGTYVYTLFYAELEGQAQVVNGHINVLK